MRPQTPHATQHNHPMCVHTYAQHSSSQVVFSFFFQPLFDQQQVKLQPIKNELVPTLIAMPSQNVIRWCILQLLTKIPPSLPLSLVVALMVTGLMNMTRMRRRFVVIYLASHLSVPVGQYWFRHLKNKSRNSQEESRCRHKESGLTTTPDHDNLDTGKNWPDNRVILTQGEMSEIPYRYICHLRTQMVEDSEEKDNYTHGTGFLVQFTQGSLVLTAGHNLWNELQYQKVFCVTVSFPRRRPVNIYSEDMWLDVERSESDGEMQLGIDSGALNLDGTYLTALGQGFTDEDGMDIDFWETSPEANTIFIAGYPYPLSPMLHSWTWLLYLRNKQSYEERVIFRADGSWIVGQESHEIRHTCWTDHGDSGSPIYVRKKNKQWVAVAVHTAGAIPYNVAVKIKAYTWLDISAAFRGDRGKSGYIDAALHNQFGEHVASIEDFLDKTLKESKEKYNKLKDDTDPANAGILEKHVSNLEWIWKIFHFIKATLPLTGSSLTRLDDWGKELLGLIEDFQMQLSFQKSVEEL